VSRWVAADGSPIIGAPSNKLRCISVAEGFAIAMPYYRIHKRVGPAKRYIYTAFVGRASD
jgi:hypothetical protein